MGCRKSKTAELLLSETTGAAVPQKEFSEGFMSRRTCWIVLLGIFQGLTAACTNKKSVDTQAGVGRKQPDKVLFDKAMDAMPPVTAFDVSAPDLADPDQLLLPDSEYITRAKAGSGPSVVCRRWNRRHWLRPSRNYSDFEIFFPNMAETAEAQLKIANIHYQQMEKSDRDFTPMPNAPRTNAASWCWTYPDSKLVPESGSPCCKFRKC